MRFLFKTAYTQDLGLFRDSVQRNAYVALLAGLIVLPKVVPDYLVDVTLVFIYGLCGLSLMTLAGYTGLVSLGHAAFLGIGAYAHVFFAHDLKMPWVLSVALAAAVTAAAGVVVGLPALRMTGVYLSIATPTRVWVKNAYSAPHSTTVPTMIATYSWLTVTPATRVALALNGVGSV